MIIYTITNTSHLPYDIFCKLLDEMGAWKAFERGLFDGLNASIKSFYKGDPQYELGYEQGRLVGEQYPDSDHIEAFKNYCEAIGIDPGRFDSFDVRMFRLDNGNTVVNYYDADGNTCHMAIVADEFQTYLDRIYALRELGLDYYSLSVA